jgi:transcriptional regulator with XRE-family HTH domain
MATIGQRLRDARERRFMTQEELSKASGVQIVTISRIENDRTAGRPRLTTIRKLAEALNEDPGWIMFGESEADVKPAA